MRIIRYLHEGHVYYGIVDDRGVRPCDGDPFTGLIRQSDVLDLAETKLLPPVIPPNIICRLDGEVMQASNTADMMFPVRRIVSHLSHSFTPLPGTLILTGTPGGVGFMRKPPVYLRPEQVVEVEIEGIGTLRNPVTG
jgi:2-keto-4-pentenoate hydratase/2-oxohepta-3-ene-1,7-dioic acid hydratase in catechol pathway